jgi:outer membrane immunogenic protein
MSKLLHVIALVCSLQAMSILANAADISVPPPLAPAPLYAPPPINWTGFYLGANVGGAWVQGNFTDSLFGLNLNNGTDFIAGEQIGFNYQIGAFVLGVDGAVDFSPNDRTGHGVVTPVGTIQATSNNTWIATLAARFGVGLDHWLLYGKAGGSWIGNSFAVNNLTTSMSIPGSNSDGNIGWLAGAGVEWALTRNWTLKVEYTYLGLNSSSFTAPATAPFLGGDTFTTNRNFQMVQVGFNYLFTQGD